MVGGGTLWVLLSRPPLVGLHLISQRLVGLNSSVLLVVHGIVEELLRLMLRGYHTHGPICSCVRKLRVWLADLVLVCLSLSLLLVRSLLLIVVCGLVRLVGVA